MLLVPCPWCGPRPENEFRYGGEAHIERPADPSIVNDAAWANFLYMRSNPKGTHAERWRHLQDCRSRHRPRYSASGQLRLRCHQRLPLRRSRSIRSHLRERSP